MIRNLLITLIVLSATFRAFSNSPEGVALRAERFYNQHEWASASAMLGLLLDEQPQNPKLYARAIVSAYMRADTVAPLSLMQQAIDHHLPFDSVFYNVRNESFALGKTNLYEKFLLSVQSTHPWLARSIDRYLLDYYTFRRNGEQMIAYSNKMLVGLPDNTAFMRTLADGYLLVGDTSKAMETFRRIVAIDSGNLQALLYLANYYQQLARENRSNREYPSLAMGYFIEAEKIAPSPYIEEQISRLKRISDSK